MPLEPNVSISELYEEASELIEIYEAGADEANLSTLIFILSELRFQGESALTRVEKLTPTVV